MIEFSITLQSDTTLEDEQQIREKLLAVVWNTLIDNGQSNAIVGTSVIAKSVPLTTVVDNVRKVVGSATIAKDGTITAVIMDDETWDKIKAPGPFSLAVNQDGLSAYNNLGRPATTDELKVEHGMIHYPAKNPKTTAPTGECGQMGFVLELCTDLNEVTCPQCKKIMDGELMPAIRHYKITQVREVFVMANSHRDAIDIAHEAFEKGQDANNKILKKLDGVYGDTVSKVKTTNVNSTRTD